MLKEQVLNTVIGEFKKTLNAECSVWDTNGECLATTDKNDIFIRDEVEEYLDTAFDQDVSVTNICACFSICVDGETTGVFVIHTPIENAEAVGRLCVMQLETVERMKDRKIDKNTFFQQLFLDNMLLVDINSQAKKLGIETEKKREIFVIEPKRREDNLAREAVRTLYSEDFVTSIAENKIILIKSLDDQDDYDDVAEIARSIVDALGSDALIDVRVAYGNIVMKLEDLSKCYKEADMALDVGRVFYADRKVLAYNNLGIGRLIHQLPVSLCEMFLKESFSKRPIERLDEETLLTVNAFFDNNLNVSETARQIYLHRNTLGYRLDKIMRITGLDVRKFDDALTFKIALMVSAHLKSVRTEG